MRTITLLLLLMTSLNSIAQNGKAQTVKKTFSRETIITQKIKASDATIWSLLTNAADFPKWNSTVISIDGKIQLGEKIKLKSTLDSSRTFKLKVKEFIVNKTLVWGDAMGKRTYTLKKEEDHVVFTMTEKIGSFMFPLFANKIPSFDASFEQFVADLKKEAESN